MSHEGFDLLRVRMIRALVRWGGFPYVFQAGLLTAFAILAARSWGVFSPGGLHDGELFAKTHLVTLVIWGLWWPAMVVVVILLGRVWCTICPLELVSNVSERLGRSLGLAQRPIGRYVASGTIIVILYAVVHLLIAGAHINAVPAYTAYFLVGLMSLAAVTGFVFKDRAYCRGFCPVSLLLRTYGRGGMLAVRPGPQSRCQACTGRECMSARNRNRLDARSCPSLLHPSTLNASQDCLVCGQCIKTCPHQNMRLLLRWPFSAFDVREPAASWPVTLFVMLDSGFVTTELLEHWSSANKLFFAAPGWTAVKLGWPVLADWFGGIWALFAFPLVLWCGLAGVARLCGARGTLGGLWRRMALPLLVIVAAAHMWAAVAHSSDWAAFLPGALRDPNGVKTANAITSGTLPIPAGIIDFPIIAGVGLGLVVAALLLAVREYHLAQTDGATI